MIPLIFSYEYNTTTKVFVVEMTITEFYVKHLTGYKLISSKEILEYIDVPGLIKSVCEGRFLEEYRLIVSSPSRNIMVFTTTKIHTISMKYTKKKMEAIRTVFNVIEFAINSIINIKYFEKYSEKQITT